MKKTVSPNQRKALELIAAGNFVPGLVKEDDGWHARWFPLAGERTQDGIGLWLDEYVRAAAMTPLSADAEEQRYDTLHDAWINALKSRTGLVKWDDEECAVFARTLEAWTDREAFAARGGITFRLITEDEKLFVACDVPKGRAALKALGMAVYEWGKLREVKRKSEKGKSADELRVEVSRNEAEDFVKRGAPALARAGYGIERGAFAAKVTAAAEIAAAEKDGGRKTKDKGGLPTFNLQPSTFNLIVKVDGKKVSAEEIKFLLEQKSSFVFFRDHWIEVDRGILKEALRALEKAKGEKVNPVAFALGIGAIGRLEIDEAKVGGAIAKMIAEIRSISVGLVSDKVGKDSKRPYATLNDFKGFVGELREYQRLGVKWLETVTRYGFGALLADDMGLGKTIQTIAWLLRVRRREGTADNFLVVAPLTLLANWKREIEKFAPGLKVYVHQGEERHYASGFKQACAEADVVLTSYNLLVREHMLFREVAWDGLVLDEAQAIKNFDTHTARAVRALMPRYRVALTGTPIENTVEDLWSIEEFLNPGFLGERKEFEERFVKPLAVDPMCRAGKKLRKALEPFVLRRLKSDPAIAAELGGKVDIKEYCELTAAQREEYERAVGDYRVSVRRQGDVFALITALKLVCDGEGKLARLTELLAQIFAAGESALVFTQYAKVGAWLKRELDKRFKTDVPFLHGGLSAREREREIARFNNSGLPISNFKFQISNYQLSTTNCQLPNLFILSLRAGGFGMNLTKATHVIHFDRWWNPAVEGQATDRAHRIGQDRDVFVHEFITVGTLEEHIDDILAKKQTLEGLLKEGEELWKAVELG